MYTGIRVSANTHRPAHLPGMASMVGSLPRQTRALLVCSDQFIRARLRTCADREPEVSRASNRRVVCPVSRRRGPAPADGTQPNQRRAPEGNPMSMGGRALHPPKRPRHRCPGILLPPVVIENISTAQPEPFSCELLLRTPLVIPYSTLAPPARTRKTPPPRPASRARPPPPPPWVRTRSVSTRQGRVRKMIPVSVCAGGGPEVLWLLHYPVYVRHSQYPCGGSGGIFLSFRNF